MGVWFICFAQHKDSQNYEQKTSTLKLLIDVHRSMNNFQGM